ncbi:anti-sigma factor domain-containing protein [Clostridium sp. OS1-26]|uniref:anti-sigma factor domain-containing protein n=1 Tax=Clostridium sp. OS1-26 TaxID=3070681 RepID=UPI0027DF3E2D|nr:anti-sigma factor domain-containing protein [Clostridium sp. OS1-26]WML33849.1 anti-sigma factor domain-containing protein [Clostridium sp. OS1-26]
MNIKNGLVMEIKENAAYIMTPDGEFLKIKIDKSKALPVVGGEYKGKVYSTPFIYIRKFKYITAACLIFFVLSLGGGVYAYYIPVSTVTISINPSIEFKLNRWNRVLSSQALNSDGDKILKEIKTKNTQIDDALVMVVNQAKEDKYINDNYINADKTIAVNITGKEIGLPSLEKELSENNLNAKIDNNGTTVFNKTNKSTNNISPKNNNSNSNKSNADKANSNPNKNYNASDNDSDSSTKNNNGLGNNKKYNDDFEKSNKNSNKFNDDKQHGYDKEDKNGKHDTHDKGNKNKEK